MTIESELLKIQGSRELLKPEDIVEWAEDHPDSELWKQFEWNDDVAAREHRLWQARRILAIHITTEEGVRSMISLSIDRVNPGGGYRRLDDILASEKLFDVMLADALAELKRLELKYQQLKALKPVWQTAARVAAAQKKKRKGKGRRKGGDEQPRIGT